MANITGAQNGNWSSVYTWQGGVVPGTGDDVYSGGFTITIDQDIEVNSLRTGFDGGVFQCEGFVVTAESRGGTTTCLELTGPDSKQIGDSNGGNSLNAVGTKLLYGAVQIGDSHGSIASATAYGTVAAFGSVHSGNSFPGSNSPGTLLTNGAYQIGNAKSIVNKIGTTGTNSYFIGNASGGNNSGGIGCYLTENSYFFGNTYGGSNPGARGLVINGFHIGDSFGDDGVGTEVLSGYQFGNSQGGSTSGGYGTYLNGGNQYGTATGGSSTAAYGCYIDSVNQSSTFNGEAIGGTDGVGVYADKGIVHLRNTKKPSSANAAEFNSSTYYSVRDTADTGHITFNGSPRDIYPPSGVDETVLRYLEYFPNRLIIGD
jgi:hypothetical protein